MSRLCRTKTAKVGRPNLLGELRLRYPPFGILDGCIRAYESIWMSASDSLITLLFSRSARSEQAG